MESTITESPDMVRPAGATYPSSETDIFRISELARCCLSGGGGASLGVDGLEPTCDGGERGSCVSRRQPDLRRGWPSVYRALSLRAGLVVLVLAGAFAALTPLAAQASLVQGLGSRGLGSGSTLSPESSGGCVVSSLPSFVEQGEYGTAASVADAIGVECEASYAGQSVEVTAEGLNSQCNKTLRWATSSGGVFGPSNSDGVTTVLDAEGDASVVALAGLSCTGGGESQIYAHFTVPPYEVATSFIVTPPINETEGVHAMPSSEVAAGDNSVATIVQLGFKNAGESYVSVDAAQVYDRCRRIEWVTSSGTVSTARSVDDVRLDDNGNAFVILFGLESCASGPSMIEATLEEPPFITETTEFTALPTIATGNGAGCEIRSLPSAKISQDGNVQDSIEVACQPFYAHHVVEISSPALNFRCDRTLTWMTEGGTTGTPSDSSSITVELNAEGKASVIASGGPGCFTGESLIYSDLLEDPYETVTTSFLALPPAKLCMTNTGTVTLSPGLADTAHVQTLKIKGKLTGCGGGSFTGASYMATVKTTDAVSCSVLTGAGEPASGSAKFKWKPHETPSAGTLSLPLTETSGVAFSGAVEAGTYSRLPLSGTVSETFTGGAKCGQPEGKKKAKPIKKGTFIGSAVSLE
jgi:hypothetical protein